MRARSIISRTFLRDVCLICIGSALYAFGVVAFQVPNGLAAGGLTGVATVVHAVAQNYGLEIPVGLQTLVVNIGLMVFVVRAGGLHYISRTIVGIVVSAVFIDLFDHWVPNLAPHDMPLAALWGGVTSGVGLGLVFRSGGNTGGIDIIAQLSSRKTSIPVGTMSIIWDVLVVAISAPVFSLTNALYATVCIFVMGLVLDYVIDGPCLTRAAYVISAKADDIADAVMRELDRGCTQINSRGMWSKEPRPTLFVILGRSEVGMLKSIVAEIDPGALVVISEVHEAFGNGFKQISSSGQP